MAHEPPRQAGALQTLIRHGRDAVEEPSTCGTRQRLISSGDDGVAAWVHTVDLDGGRRHYHKVAAELYYVLDGEGTIELDGQCYPIEAGSLVHIAPGVVHTTHGRMRALIVGIPDISDADIFFPDDAGA
jgi:quercetin dioxygenase-like cupin family protein